MFCGGKDQSVLIIVSSSGDLAARVVYNDLKNGRRELEKWLKNVVNFEFWSYPNNEEGINVTKTLKK